MQNVGAWIPARVEYGADLCEHASLKKAVALFTGLYLKKKKKKTPNQAEI